MQTFKLTPKPRSDFRLEVQQIRDRCKLERHGYRHNKIIYGFSDDLPDMAGLQSLGLNIEEIPFDEAQLKLTNYLVERGRAKSKIEHLRFERDENGAKMSQEEAAAQQKLTVLNNVIQETKEALGVMGTVKILKF